MAAFRKHYPWLILLLVVSILTLIFYFSSWKSYQQITFTPAQKFYTYGETLHFQPKLAKLSGGAVFLKESGQKQVLVYGPYIELPPGEYKVSFEFVIEDSLPTEHQVVVDIASENGKVLLEKSFSIKKNELNNYRQDIILVVDNNLNRFETRVYTNTNAVGLSKIQLTNNNIGIPDIRDIIYVELLIYSLLITLIIVFGSCYLSRKMDNLALLSILFVIPILLALSLPKHNLTGDEPIYLINMKNILNNHTLASDQGFTSDNISEFIDEQYVNHWLETPSIWQMHKSVKTQEYYSNHGFLMSMILIPGYIIGGIKGVYVEMGLFVGGITCLTYLILKRLSQTKEMAFMASIMLLLTTPLIYYTYAIYPEVIAAFIILLSVMSFFNKSFFLKIFSLLALGALLLLKTKYIFPVLISIIFILLSYIKNLNRHPFYKDSKFYVLVIVSMISISLYFFESYLLYGSTSLFSKYTGGRELSINLDLYSLLSTFSLTFLANFFHSRAGIFIWIPITIFAPIGLYHLFISKYKEQKHFAVYSFLNIAFYMAFYSLSGSIGGDSPPLRPWITVIPLVVILSTIAVQYLRLKSLLIIFLVPSLYQVLGSYLLKTTVVNIYDYRYNPFFLKSGTIFSHVGLFLPQLTAQRGISIDDIIMILILILIIALIYRFFYKGSTEIK